MQNKRGLSAVITTLIIIILVFVAVGIVWVVIQNVISEGTEEISLGRFTLSLEIKSVKVNENDIDVKVKRNSGEGKLSGLKFIISDGVNTQVFEEQTTMEELAENTFTLNYDGLVKDVSIAPILKSESGKEITGNEVDKLEFSNKQILKNLGAVSWWRFEGHAQDEIGNNDGTLNGGVDCDVEGKFGKACEFDGSSGYIIVPYDTSLGLSAYTVSVWVMPDSGNTGWRGIVGKKGRNYNIWYHADNDYIHHRYCDGAGYNSYASDTPSNSVKKEEWNHLTITNDGLISKTYINGNGETSGSVTGNLCINQTILNLGRNLDERSGGYFIGKLDNAIIFNKALSEDEIKALYELNLS